MKNTLNRSTTDADGTIWYIQPGGTRQRAAILKCKMCDESFATYPRGNTGYCSQECVRRSCLRCGGDFHPSSNRAVYCSFECKRGTGVCENCGKSYVFSHHGAKRFCSLACFYQTQTPIGSTIPQGDGYVLIKVAEGTPGAKKAATGGTHWMLEHRYVMQQKLGRALVGNENVHHINGKRDDNRPENLELWKRSQPAGVRSADYHCPGCRCGEEGFR